MKEGQRGRCFCQPCPSLCPSCADVPSSSSKWSLTFVACSVQRARCIIKYRNLTKAKRSRSILISICIEIINYNKYIYSILCSNIFLCSNTYYMYSNVLCRNTQLRTNFFDAIQGQLCQALYKSMKTNPLPCKGVLLRAWRPTLQCSPIMTNRYK